MSAGMIVLAAILVGTLLVQAVLPRARLLAVTTGAGAACLASSLLGIATTSVILAEVPWEVIVILVGLGLLSEMFAASRLFGVLAAFAARRTKGDPRRIILFSAGGMYVVSGLVNNLTALLLVLPVLLIVLKLGAVRQRYVSWTIGVVLVACNLGGAATPIGDFPAILLLARGSMTFASYLGHAAPPTAVALAVFLGAVLLLVRPERELDDTPLGRRLSVAVVTSLHRGFRIERRILLPAAVMLGAMLVAWTVAPRASGLTPELICWVGVAAALAAAPGLGERLIKRRVDVEAVLFLLSLFVMIGAVRRSGLFTAAAGAIAELPISPLLQLVAFLVLAALTTGLFSAGPSMAALLEVAEALAGRLPGAAVYVGLALAVCAGSSLFLTAATSGPLAQALTERSELSDAAGNRVRFAFFDFLPVGLLAFAIILAVAIATALALVAAYGG